MGIDRTLTRYDQYAGVKIFQDTYVGAAEVNTEITEDTIIDLGTINVSVGNSWSAAACVHLESTDLKIHNLKAFITSKLKGIKPTIDASDPVLTAALASAGTDAGYPNPVSGKFPDWTPVTVTAGESNRIQFQMKGIKTEAGDLPYDPTKDLIVAPASLLMMWDEENYKQRLDGYHGKQFADALQVSKGLEVWAIAPNGTLVSLGDFDMGSPPTIEEPVEVEKEEKGFPPVTLATQVTKRSAKFSGTLESENKSISALLQGGSFYLDTATNTWVKTSPKGSSLPEVYLLMICYSNKGYATVFEVPRAQITMSGTQTMGGKKSVQFDAEMLADSFGNPYYDRTSSNECHLLEIGLKYTLTVA